MAEKRGAEADPGPAKKSAPAKGARSSGEAKAPRGRSAARASATTAEGSASGRTTSARGASKGNGRAGRASAAGKGGRGSRSGGTRSGVNLRKDLREFASARPDGWGHDDWLRFLDDLQARGHNINDRDQIGLMLERERLALTLERIPGVGPQRVKSIADRYGYVWRLRETDPDQLAREANLPRSVAEKVIQAVRG